jgi:heme/copper-type cytochrome/quinol oxidase subunit 3
MRHKQDTNRYKLWLLVTLALGLTFLFFEIRDFQEMLAMGADPDRSDIEKMPEQTKP